ncbi:uncharacterized protein [Solanum tuberosum]|uniref:DUF4408 domain-containing protein n=1 Tax=Solanum tuberosum TaxID=4113 RepID=M1BP37_SOLTU|nr:PREDICTED: uncharacterized protein LOC102585998 [Solanum tuberosum]
MANLFQSSGSSMLSIKIFLISTTVLSAAIMLKVSAPVVTDFAVSEVPSIWNGVVSWLKPPYLYLVINCIIITIVASSKLQNKLDENSSPVPAIVSPENLSQFHPIKDVRPVTDYYSPALHDLNGSVLKNQAVEARPIVYEYPTAGVYDAKVEKVPVVNPYTPEKDISFNVNAFTYPEPNEVVAEKDDFVISKSSWAPVMRQDSIDYSISGNSAEKPPASARFAHRRNVKSTPEGGKGALRVSKPKRQDTLESTWKTITEGRAMPLTRHLRKSDTWETHGGRNPATPPQQKMKKSETFNDKTTPDSSPLLTPSPGGSGKLKKEPSLSQDELNRRVEAFIKKFNEDMRLQRQQSMQQYTQMINRGSH